MLKQIKNKRQAKYVDAIIFSSPDVRSLLQIVNIIAFYFECVRDAITTKIDRAQNIGKALSSTEKFKKLIKDKKIDGADNQAINEFLMEADVINNTIRKYQNSSAAIDLDESSLLFSKLFRLQYILSILRAEMR